MRSICEIAATKGANIAFSGRTPVNEAQFLAGLHVASGSFTWADYLDGMREAAAEERVEALRAEAARRIQAVLGARDERDAEIKQLNALRKVAEINYRRTEAPDTFTAADAAYLAAANEVSQLIDAIRDRSNAFPSEGAIDDDALWPAMGG